MTTEPAAYLTATLTTLSSVLDQVNNARNGAVTKSVRDSFDNCTASLQSLVDLLISLQ